MSDLFLKATKSKFRFASPQGSLTVEDLWDLPLTTSSHNKACLDNIAIELNREIQQTSVSFVSKSTPTNESLKDKLEIVKTVIEVRLAENQLKLEASHRADQKQVILGLIAEKQNEALKSKPVEELQELVKNL